MNGKQLKNSILQWAIQGKLVPQDPNDEPASVLLDRIRAEKARLVKEGKIKKDKNESVIFKGDDNSYYEKFADGRVVCIDDEIPFEIPAGWEWCRLTALLEVKGGKRLPLGESFAEGITPHIYIRVTDMKDETIVDNNLKYISESVFEKIKNYYIEKDDLYLTIAGTIGAVGVVPDKFHMMNLTENAVKLTHIGVDKKYLVLVITSPTVQGQFQQLTNQQAQPKLSIRSILSTLVPVPPMKEQHRIVERFNLIKPAVIRYDESQASLDHLNQAIGENLKRSILQEAIQGRLVPQNPDDEPATKLLEKISAEKQRLVKEGKLKAKDAVSSVIFKGEDNKYYEQIGSKVLDITDEIPFDIPDSWCWVRLSNIAQIVMGQSPDGSTINNNTGAEFHQGKIYFTNDIIGRSPYYTSAPSKYAEPLSLLLCVRAPVGVANITDRRLCIGRGLCSAHFYKGINLDLYFRFISTYKAYYDGVATGSTFKAISKEIVERTIIPLPPAQEQLRIMEAIDALEQAL